MQSVQFYYISSLILIAVQSPFKKRQTNGDETDSSALSEAETAWV